MPFVVNRLARAALAMFACSFLVYASLEVVPGGPVAAVTRGRVLSEADRQRIVEFYGLDRPFLQRYWDWLVGVLHGDLGTSLATREPVSTVIGERAQTTFELLVYAAVLVAIAGVGAGALAAMRGGPLDRAVVIVTAAMTATPPFVTGIVLVSVFAVTFTWFPTFGAGSGFGDRLWHLTLPALALAAASIGYVARITRAAVAEERGREHVLAAESRGLERRGVRIRHVYRNATLPVVTGLGTAIAGLAVASVVVEQMFGLGGLGSLLVESVLSNDFPVVQGVVLLLVAVFVGVNLVVDLSYPMLDPRVRIRR